MASFGDLVIPVTGTFTLEATTSEGLTPMDSPLVVVVNIADPPWSPQVHRDPIGTLGAQQQT